MSTPFVGETRIFAFGFAPPGWLPCDGRLVPVPDLPQLFQLIGTTYGGNGETDFALPAVTPPESGGTPLSVCISLFGAAPGG